MKNIASYTNAVSADHPAAITAGTLMISAVRGIVPVCMPAA